MITASIIPVDVRVDDLFISIVVRKGNLVVLVASSVHGVFDLSFTLNVQFIQSVLEERQLLDPSATRKGDFTAYKGQCFGHGYSGRETPKYGKNNCW